MIDQYLCEAVLEADFKAELEKKDDLPVGAWFSYFEMSSDEIVYNQNDILSYTVSFENYTGGAHGSHAYNNHVINLKTGNAITEEDIFIGKFGRIGEVQLQVAIGIIGIIQQMIGPIHPDRIEFNIIIGRLLRVSIATGYEHS